MNSTEPAKPRVESSVLGLGRLQYWQNPTNADPRLGQGPLEPVSFGEWVAYFVFFGLTGALFLYSILWFSAAAMRMR